MKTLPEPPAAVPAPADVPLTAEELQLGARNHAMPLEMLAIDRSPAGMHYLLIHFDVPVIDAGSWRLRIGGAVRRPLEFTLAQLQAREQRTLAVTLECAGNGRSLLKPRPIGQPWLHGGVGTAEWTGTPLAPLLEEAGVEPDAVDIVFTGADRGIQGGEEQDYARSLPVSEALSPDVLLAYAMNGAPLPPQHGFPVRLVVPGWYGMASVKWLAGIEARTRPFTGFQQIQSYCYKTDETDPGEPVTRMKVRALMVPPGIPDFLTRHRLVDSGPVLLHGRAWSGRAPIQRVQVAVDGVWSDARLDAPEGEFAWRGWSFHWQAEPGEHELMCRAVDALVRIQPQEPEWNWLGMGNNAVQKMAVTVRTAR
ncbi:sulfite oxidase [Arthrobacter sp. GCM10027362]|uniref:sulfite oxidase n=1 Tax=Arthrobacter sp. GCM10027362 TaxID=3273379 RepID=UPI003637A88A